MTFQILESAPSLYESSQHKHTTASASSSSSFHQDDVLLGRGGQTNKHVGNKRYRSIVQEHQGEYLLARKKDKVLIARRIVRIVQSHGGRFLKQNSNTEWEPVDDKRATAKTSQALREGLDVRNKVGTKASPKRKAEEEPSSAVKRTKTTTAAAYEMDDNATTVTQEEPLVSSSLPRPVTLRNDTRHLSVTDVCAI